jgi:hypothetical protein
MTGSLPPLSQRHNRGARSATNGKHAHTKSKVQQDKKPPRKRKSIANVLEALGVVLNVSRQYDEAVQCLRLATYIRQDDYG